MILNGRTDAGAFPTMPLAKALRIAALISLLLGAIAAHPYGPTVAIGALCAWSLLGAKQALQALSLIVIIKFLNPAIYQFTGPLALLAWAALAVGGLRIFYDSLKIGGPRHPIIPWLWLFSLAVFVQSLLASHDSVVSLFKILAFTYAATVVLLGFKATASRAVDWTPWFLGLWAAIIVLSLPTLLFPKIGFLVNGRGFQGILNHPQALGTFLAPMVAWLTARLLLSPARRDHWLYLAVPLAWSLLYLTQARTAAIAVVAGFLVVTLSALWIRPAWRKPVLGAVLRPTSIVLALALVAIFALQPSLILEPTKSFVLKGDEAATVEQSFQSSRGQGIEAQWQDFLARPLFGIGFGVSLDKSFKPIFDPLTGLPVSAAVEKGFLPTAILQETGIFGTTFFVVFLLSLIRLAFSIIDIVLPWVFLTCLFVNAGEMIFFSANGLGLYIWLLMGWATCWRWEKIGAP